MRPALAVAVRAGGRTRAALAVILLCVAAHSALPVSVSAQNAPEPGDPAVRLHLDEPIGTYPASDTVQVTAPTGHRETDRTSILAALDQVEPGGTIRFAPGTYLIGEIIHVTVPGITVLGHPDGTTLRGCHPDMFPRQGGMEEMFVAVVSCNGLDMAGGHQTVRGLTFEYAWHALVLGGMECIEGRGCVPVLEPVESRTGGYRVEDNTFRTTGNGIRTLGQWSEPAVIRGNRFINTFHAVVVHGSIVHVVENDISVPEPERVPAGHPGGAMIVSATDLNAEVVLLCAGNVIAGNRIRGHPDGIAIRLLRAGVSCRDNVIRQNTIAVERVQVTASWWGVTPTESDSSAVGVPIALINEPKADPEMFGSAEVDEQEGMLEGNLIEGNVISGAEGIGIELLHASGNRIVNNTITGVARRDPFPGIIVNSFDPQKSGWREANGSGIWVSPGSDENEILGNTFDDIASYAIVLEGDRNRVVTRSASDAVRDLGTGNRWTRGEPEEWTDPSPHQVRFVAVAPDVRLEVLDWGGTGRPLVLLAGMMATAHTFDDFAPGLTDRFRVLAVTRRGFGASSQPEAGYDLDTLVDDVRIVLDSLGIERAALLGHSFGAAEIVRFAGLWPERVSHLVNVDGLMAVDPEGLVDAIGAAPTWPPPGDAERASVPAFADYIARIYGVRLPEGEIRARWRVLPDGRIGEEITPERITGALAQAIGPTPLDDVRAPLLAFRAVPTTAAAWLPYYGELDAENHERADQAFPALQRVLTVGWAPYAEMEGARIIDFQDANHHLYISHEREVIEAVREFLLGSSDPTTAHFPVPRERAVQRLRGGDPLEACVPGTPGGAGSVAS